MISWRELELFQDKLGWNRKSFCDIPLLSKEGQPRSGGVVCSKTRSHLMMIAKRSLSIGTVRL
jgi:hypothetical protein